MGTPQIHRDLYVGVMVSQMFKEGYFDEEFQYFGYAYLQDDELKYLVSTGEKVAWSGGRQSLCQRRCGSRYYGACLREGGSSC